SCLSSNRSPEAPASALPFFPLDACSARRARCGLRSAAGDFARRPAGDASDGFIGNLLGPASTLRGAGGPTPQRPSARVGPPGKPAGRGPTQPTAPRLPILPSGPPPPPRLRSVSASSVPSLVELSRARRNPAKG